MKTSELREVLRIANQGKPPKSWPAQEDAIDTLHMAGKDLAAEVIRLREALAKLHRVDSTEVPDVEGLLTEHDE